MACFAGALGAAAACSSPSSSSPSPSNDGGSDSTDGPASDSGTAEVIADAAPATVNGCTAADFAANDRTADAAERVILAPDGPAPAQFSPHCMRVRASQTVTWKGDLSSHPISYKLIAAADGGFNDAATVATHGDADGGATQDTVQANDEMTIAFRCDEHPTIMFGAVDVVP
jgi:hypothetical protein